MPAQTGRDLKIYKTTKPVKRNIEITNPFQENLKEKEEELSLIQGQVPGSKEEWRLAQALILEEIDFIYQYEIYGGRDIAGGQVIDFVVFIPMATPVQVYSEHWHTGELGEDDRMKEAMAAEEFGREVIAFWGPELTTIEVARQAIKGKLE